MATSPSSKLIKFLGSLLGAGGVDRNLHDKLSETISVKDFGAIGDGVTDDSAAILKAVTYARDAGVVLDFGRFTYLVSTSTIIDLGTSKTLYLKGSGATVKLSNGAISNTNSSFNNFVPILRIQGGVGIRIEGITFDHNCNNQVYPTTVNTFGRGTKPWRHNGAVEITPASDNATQATNVYIVNSSFINGYLNGLALWQTKNVLIEKCTFLNNTWNGCCGAYFENFEFRACVGFRNGVSSVYNTTRQEGDRATLQIREFESGFTSATEGIPTLSFSSNQLNTGVKVQGGFFVEDNVESIFLRACVSAEVNSAFVKNVGYQRLNTASYNPAAIWCEWGSFNISNVKIFSPNSVQSGWLPADGIVCYSFSGNGTSAIPMQGSYESTISNPRIFCGQDYVNGNLYTDNANKKNNFYRGIRTNGYVSIVNPTIEGCSSYPVMCINDGNFNADEIKKVTITGGSIRNFLGDGCFFFTKFGTTTGTGGDVVITGTRVEDGRSVTAGLGRAIVLFDTTLDGFAFNNVLISNNSWDCSNSADPTGATNYLGVRQRGASTSVNLKIIGNTIANPLRAFRLACGNSIIINGNNVSATSRLFDLSLTGAVDVLSVTNNVVTGISFSAGDFSGIGSFTISRFTMTGNTLEGASGGNLLNSYTPGTGQLVAIVQPNLVSGFSVPDLRRTGTAAPTTNAFHIGEIFYRSDNTTYYIAVNVGSGSSDWKLLS